MSDRIESSNDGAGVACLPKVAKKAGMREAFSMPMQKLRHAGQSCSNCCICMARLNGTKQADAITLALVGNISAISNPMCFTKLWVSATMKP